MKDHKRLGWGKAHGGVILEEKGLSGHALQLNGETGWVDLGSLDTACPGGACSDDFSISMWFKYHLKGNDEEQTFFTFGEYSALEGRRATGGIAVIKKKKEREERKKKHSVTRKRPSQPPFHYSQSLICTNLFANIWPLVVKKVVIDHCGRQNNDKVNFSLSHDAVT